MMQKLYRSPDFAIDLEVITLHVSEGIFHSIPFQLRVESCFGIADGTLSKPFSDVCIILTQLGNITFWMPDNDAFPDKHRIGDYAMQERRAKLGGDFRSEDCWPAFSDEPVSYGEYGSSTKWVWLLRPRSVCPLWCVIEFRTYPEDIGCIVEIMTCRALPSVPWKYSCQSRRIAKDVAYFQTIDHVSGHPKHSPFHMSYIFEPFYSCSNCDCIGWTQ